MKFLLKKITKLILCHLVSCFPIYGNPLIRESNDPFISGDTFLYTITSAIPTKELMLLDESDDRAFRGDVFDLSNDLGAIFEPKNMKKSASGLDIFPMKNASEGTDATLESTQTKEESYSLVDMEGIPLDHKLIALLNKQNGIFIEVGAHDGITQSNTLLLEKNYNWKGLLIEPSECLYEILQINRPQAKCFQCALGSFSEDNTHVYGDFHGTLMDSVEGKRLADLKSGNALPKSEQTYVLMRSLQSILDEENLHHIDFFSLDTEGYEYNILKGIDYSRTFFDYLLIEIYTWDYDRICTLLKDNGYDLVECFSNYDHRSSDWDGTHNDYLFKRAFFTSSVNEPPSPPNSSPFKESDKSGSEVTEIFLEEVNEAKISNP